MRAAEIVNYKVINIHNVRDDANLSLFPGHMVELPDNFPISTGDMYDGIRFYRPVIIGDDSPVVSATTIANTATEDADDDDAIGDDTVK